MAKVKLTKTELKKQRDALKQPQNARKVNRRKRKNQITVCRGDCPEGVMIFAGLVQELSAATRRQIGIYEKAGAAGAAPV